MGRTAVRLGTAVFVALGALALVSVTTVRAYPITGVTVQVECTTSGNAAHCVATATARDSNGNPVSGDSVRFAAGYSGNTGSAPAGSCGGLNPCSTTTDRNGQATSSVDTTLCGGTITVTATITDSSSGTSKSASGQATLPPCGGTLPTTGGRESGLPATSMLPPGDDHRLGQGVLAGGILLGLGGAALLVVRRRQPQP